jgi:hypothetical protein
MVNLNNMYIFIKNKSQNMVKYIDLLKSNINHLHHLIFLYYINYLINASKVIFHTFNSYIITRF